jgi:hypothetical protein
VSFIHEIIDVNFFLASNDVANFSVVSKLHRHLVGFESTISHSTSFLKGQGSTIEVKFIGLEKRSTLYSH